VDKLVEDAEGAVALLRVQARHRSWSSDQGRLLLRKTAVAAVAERLPIRKVFLKPSST
jgi:hypothetical protein